VFNDYSGNSSTFTAGININASSATYVAYLFAHNNNDGGFGPDSEDIIKCASFTGNSSADVTVDVGFEPQWLLTRRTGGGNWTITDNMRGLATGGIDNTLFADTSGAENTAADRIDLTSTGFIQKSGQTQNETVVYMAIRRPDQSTPTVASEVFAIDTSTSDSSGDVLASTFPVDMYLNARRDGGSHGIMARLTQTRLYTDANSAEGSLGNYVDFDRQTGIKRNALLGNASTVDYMWKRAKGFCDVVAYSGTGSNRTVTHNLGAVPEMMWIKRRDSTGNWAVYHKGLDSGNNPETHYIILNSTAAEDDVNEIFNDTAPTSSVFSLGTAASVNNSSGTYIAYLFATVAGVSKVGSFTATGSDVNVDCGFTNGAKFVLIKRTNSADDWFIFRDIVAGNDKRIKLNTTDAEATGSDNIDPLSSGFTMTSGILGDSGNEFIFYAIANDPS
jgi:hypothetical protein